MSESVIVGDHFKKLFLSCTAISEDWKKRLAIASIISKIFEVNSLPLPIIVGGTAVSIYTSGQYATMDIDLISNIDRIPYLILEQLGYERHGKDFYHEELISLVEFPSGRLHGDESRTREYLVEETNLAVRIIGIEDLILDRVDSFVASDDHNSREWAMNLMGGMNRVIDWSYIHAEAHIRGIFDPFEKIQRDVKRILQKIEND
jgi:hypothetical protein